MGAPCYRCSSRQAHLERFWGAGSHPQCPRGPPPRGRRCTTAITHCTKQLSQSVLHSQAALLHMRWRAPAARPWGHGLRELAPARARRARAPRPRLVLLRGRGGSNLERPAPCRVAGREGLYASVRGSKTWLLDTTAHLTNATGC